MTNPMNDLNKNGHFLQKGDRVRAHWYAVNDACLSGGQLKFGADECEVTGTVRHIRGNHPINPTSIRVWIEPDAGGDEVIVDPKHIVEVLPSTKDKD